MKLAAVSVDLDEIPQYLAIHGLAPTTFEDHLPAFMPRVEQSLYGLSLHAVYDIALARIVGFAIAHQLPITFFAIGQHLSRPANAAALRVLSGKGHSVQNHSFGHRYDLVRLSRRELSDEIARGSQAIADAIGVRPTGFRAPGYTVSRDVFDALEDLGVAFDSSVFPCPPYYLSKAVILAFQCIAARQSASVLDTPSVLFAPRTPYRPGYDFYQKGKRSFLELPIHVTPRWRLPVIGTSVTLAGADFARYLARSCAGDSFINLELHGMDFLDREDGLQPLAAYQPELRRPLQPRLNALSAFVHQLVAQGYTFVRLDEAAKALTAGQ